MAIPPQSSLQFQHIPHPPPSSQFKDISNTGLLPDPMLSTPGLSGSKKQKTTPPCDRCRQRRIKCDRLEPTCSSCVKYKATCVRTAFPAGAPLSTVSVDAIGGPNLRTQTATGKRGRHLSEADILDSCLRDVHALQMNRLSRIEQFFDRLGIDEARLDELGWLAEQIKSQRAVDCGSTDFNYHSDEVNERLGPRAAVPWIKHLLPLLQSAQKIQQIPSTAPLYLKVHPHLQNSTPIKVPLQAALMETGQFVCPTPKPAAFPTRVPLSVLNRTMFELSVYDRTEYLGPVAGTRASSWSEEMRFPLPWLIPEPKVPESLLVLPPLERMMDLIEWMVHSPLYIYFPILTKASILNALSSAMPGQDLSPHAHEDKNALPQRITGRVSAVFLLNAIFALGAAYRTNAIKHKKPHRLLNESNMKETPLNDFQTFFDRSRALTVYILDQPRVSSLQGLLLLMKCPAIPGIQNLYREQACAMALSLGLHRDCEPWTLCRSVIQLRRNIFWCCYVIDASYSLNSGSPERFPDDYISTGLPKVPSIEDGDDVGELDAEQETRRIGFLIEQAKLWKIVKKIRRCGQVSNRSEDHVEGPNLYNNPEAVLSGGQYGVSAKTSSGLDSTMQSPMSASLLSSPPTFSPLHYPHSNYGSGGSDAGSSSSPSWIWRADSARRILDVELAQWQMELPAGLRFDFALTRREDPCPFDVRVNGLGAMLQLIFNEVLILLHHPFLVLADAQALHQRENSAHSSLRHSKSKPSAGQGKSSRSRRSSSSSRSIFGSGMASSPAQTEPAMSKQRSMPPFLNSCTKAAEAITFLIDHLLRTTPEWLVCHNEVDSALHIAERVHALNVSLVTSSGSSLSNLARPATYNNPAHAKSQLRRTKAFRKTIAELDQFTMSDGFRPELLTTEMKVKGTGRERLLRCMRKILTHQRGRDYYRLPRSPSDSDSTLALSTLANLDHKGPPVGQGVDAGLQRDAGQDHLEMKLAFAEERIWIRYYNIRIKDGVESRNGPESWIEILNPFTPASENEDSAQDEECSSGDLHAFSLSQADDMSMAVYEEGQEDIPGLDYSRGSSSFQRHANDQSIGCKPEQRLGVEEPMDPPQSSSSAFLDMFSHPTGLAQFTDMVAGSTYYPAQGDHGKAFDVIEPGYDTPIFYTEPYAPQDVAFDSFDRIDPPMALDSPLQGHAGTSGSFAQDDTSRNYRLPSSSLLQHDVSQQQQRQHEHQYQSLQFHQPDQLPHSGSPHHHHPHPLSHPSQQDSSQSQHRSRNHSALHGVFPSFELASSNSGAPSSPFSSPHSPTSSTSEPVLGLGLSGVPSSLVYDGGPYLNLLHQHFPHPHLLTHSSSPEDSRGYPSTHSGELRSAASPQIVRPFYGMPMGGFMSPSLAALPEVSRQSVQRPGHMGPTPESVSAVQPLAVAVSTPASPLDKTPFRLALSPTTESLQGLSSRLGSWDGLSGPKVPQVDVGFVPDSGLYPHQSQQQRLHFARSTSEHSVPNSAPQPGPRLSSSAYSALDSTTSTAPASSAESQLMEGIEGSSGRPPHGSAVPDPSGPLQSSQSTGSTPFYSRTVYDIAQSDFSDQSRKNSGCGPQAMSSGSAKGPESITSGMLGKDDLTLDGSGDLQDTMNLVLQGRRNLPLCPSGLTGRRG